jgi:hypothetical protein
MNAVIFYEYNQLITGSTINMFEYYLCAYQYNKDLKLILINARRSTIKKFLGIIENRYILDGIEDFNKNIICISKSVLIRMEFDTVLVLDYNTINHTRGLLRADKIIVISEKYTDRYFYSKTKYNVTYYGEMPFHYRDIKYRMKCLFYRFKPLREINTGTYINSPKNDENIERLALSLGAPEPYITKSKTKHRENLFEQFTTYFYYHADKWFDPHPRLFLECKYYGKEIIYYNPIGVKDGSWYRYYDVLLHGLKDRTLNSKDEIIGTLINE